MRINVEGFEIIFTDGTTEEIVKIFKNKNFDSSENGLLLQQTFISLAKRMREENRLVTKRFSENVFLEYQGSVSIPQKTDFLLICSMTKITEQIFVIYENKLIRFVY